MKFTTQLILKKDRPKDKYDYPVLTQHSFNIEDKRSYTKFEFNQAAMKEFGFEPNTPNVNKINWGIDEETGKLLLANTNGFIKDKISNITAKNEFSNQAFLDKLVKEFQIDPLQIHEFKLNLQPDENEFVVASLELHAVSDNINEEKEKIIGYPTYISSNNEFKTIEEIF